MTTALPEQLLTRLADGEWRSGEDLAAIYGVSRAAIWQAVKSLESRGLEVFAVRGKGYRLRQALDLLDEQTMRACSGLTKGQLKIECLGVSESTNVDLWGRASLEPPVALFAEYQSAGRGRRGRQWRQPYASGLCMSLGVDGGPEAAELSLLPLLVGVELVTSLSSLGFSGIGLKWPNDLYWQQKKLGGILIEHRGELAGRSRTIVGFGLNILSAPEGLGEEAVAAASLQEAWNKAGDMPKRSAIAGQLIQAIWKTLQHLPTVMTVQKQRDDILKKWRAVDVLAEQGVRVLNGKDSFDAEYLGVQSDGAILVKKQSGESCSLYSADVSIRPAL